MAAIIPGMWWAKCSSLPYHLVVCFGINKSSTMFVLEYFSLIVSQLSCGNCIVFFFPEYIVLFLVSDEKEEAQGRCKEKVAWSRKSKGRPDYQKAAERWKTRKISSRGQGKEENEKKFRWLIIIPHYMYVVFQQICTSHRGFLLSQPSIRNGTLSDWETTKHQFCTLYLLFLVYYMHFLYLWLVMESYEKWERTNREICSIIYIYTVTQVI